jgi:hypothetical protein
VEDAKPVGNTGVTSDGFRERTTRPAAVSTDLTTANTAETENMQEREESQSIARIRSTTCTQKQTYIIRTQPQHRRSQTHIHTQIPQTKNENKSHTHKHAERVHDTHRRRQLRRGTHAVRGRGCVSPVCPTVNSPDATGSDTSVSASWCLGARPESLPSSRTKTPKAVMEVT